MANLNEEKKLWRKGLKRVACLDESGRGSLAGPVVAAAVMIKSQIPPNLHSRIFANLKFVQIREIRDSKKLSQKQREKFYQLIIKNPMIEWGIGRASKKVIDKINILEATKLAMEKAIKNLEKKSASCKFHDRGFRAKIDFLILDGKIELDLPVPQRSIVKADEKIFSCAIASILAKVTRDRIMESYHKRYPQYGFDRHKGYPTKYHRKMLRKYGPAKIHRKSFKPVRELIAKF